MPISAKSQPLHLIKMEFLFQNQMVIKKTPEIFPTQQTIPFY